MRILCTGLSHKSTGVALREKLVFSAAQASRALGELSRRWPGGEYLILSTCNRTELYIARAVHGHPREQEAAEWLGEFHSLPLESYIGSLYELADQEAVGHFFRVAAGLESMVPGESQIVGQIKQAYELSRQAGVSGPTINELVQTALHVAKHVRSETPLARGKVSVASVAMDCVKGTVGSLRGKTVLNIGAGKMNSLMLRQMVQAGAGRVLVANRSIRKATELAKSVGGQAVALADLAGPLEQADVIVTSTASPRPILKAGMLEISQRHRKHRRLLIVDLAVPRDVEDEARKIRGVKLFNIDQLDKIVQASLGARRGGMASALAVVDEHLAQCTRSLNLRKVAPTIDALYRRMEQIAREELDVAMRKLSTHDDAQADEAILRQVLHRTVRRILHRPAHNLRNCGDSDATRVHVASLEKLFELTHDVQVPAAPAKKKANPRAT